MDVPGAAIPMRNSSPRPIAKYAKPQPRASSGTAALTKMYVHFFSREYSPGAMNAQIWYSQIGLLRITPAKIAIFTLK